MANPKTQKGFSLVEALLSTSLFGLAITGLAGSLIIGQQASVNAGSRARATDLAIEGIESVRNIRDEAFNELRFNQSGVDNSTNEWVFSGEGTTETIDIFTRTISFSEVCRDSNDEIASCPASYSDPHTKEITSTVDWAPRPGASASVSRTTYLTNWETYVWPQTDWSGGAGQAQWSDTARYDSDDGNVDTATPGELKLAGGSGTPVSFIDDEQAEFSQGTNSNTQYDTGNTWLELTAAGQTAGNGSFDSRIFDAGGVTDWSTIQWTPERPIGKELPGSGTSEADYPAGNANMANNQLLLHLNETAGATSFADASGQGNNASCTAPSCPTAGSSGRFKTAVNFDGTDDVISVPHSAGFASGSAFTASAWVNVDSLTSPDHNPILWKGTQIGWGANYMFRIAVNAGGDMTWGVTYGSTEDWFAAGTISLGSWNHVALSYDGSTARAYINGVEVGTNGGGGSAANTFSGQPIRSGMAYRSTPTEETHLDGSVDEVGFWSRTLGPTEIADQYQRGALNLQFQVRSCDDAACSGESFIGPDGTGSTYYAGIDNSTIDLPSFNLTNVTDNQYLQYRSYLTTTDSLISPELIDITLSGTVEASDWWDANYGYRQRITFGTSHSLLPAGYTASLTLDTQPSGTNVALASGDDVRIVWQPASGSPVELDRLGSNWNTATTLIDFRLKSAIPANDNVDTDGNYYVYYGNASAGTPPTNEMNVYYFADFFDRSDSSTVGNGWTEWTTGGGNVSIASGAAAVVGNNTGPADAGIKESFPLGAIPGDFILDFDWTMPTNSEGIWTHYVNIGNSASMVDSSRTTGVGPGIYNGEGSHFSPNVTENVSNNLNNSMEGGVNGGPHAIQLVVHAGSNTYDYYRDSSLVASGQSWVNSGTTLNQIRIATDQYASGQPAFTYDNLKISLTASDEPEEVASNEETSTSGQILDDTQAEFDAGTHSSTQYDSGNNWLELDGAGQSAGSGTYISQVYDAGSSSTWDDLNWVPERPTGKELPNNGTTATNWWNTSYGYRKKVTFGTSHSTLPLYYTAAFAMDTRTSANIALTSGNDVRVVWQPTVGSAVELNRLGDTWNNASTTIRFRLQSAIPSNADTDTDGDYYVYYGNASAGTPPTNEMNVYYFADFFNRSNSSTIGNGWTEWNGGSSDVSITGNALAVRGHTSNYNGVKQTFPLGAITGDFSVEFDWTMPSNRDSTWKHYLNIGNSASMSDTNQTAGVGPGIYNGEGSDFVPNGVENISNNLAGNMENNVNGGPYGIRIVVNSTAKTYDYYRNGVLRASNRAWVNSGATLDQIRIASRQYSQTQPVFTYDNVRVSLNVSTSPLIVVGTEQAQGSGAIESGYTTGNVNMGSNQLLLHLNDTVGSTSFTDNSGANRNPTCSGSSCPTAGAIGQLNGAVTFDGSNDILTVPTTLSQWLGGTASLSYWIKTTQTGNNTFWQAPGVVGVEESGGGNDIFWGWLDATGHIGFKVGDGAGLQSSSPVNDGTWHHILMTRNSTTGAIALYVDGAAQTTTSETGTKTTSFSEIGRIGDTGGTPVYFAGSIDEFSVWNRVLSATEATDVYRRAALNMRIQVRSCNDAACSGETFVGPDGTASTYYDELSNTTLNPPATSSITNLDENRYFQYQVLFTTQNSSISPELLSLTVNYSRGSGGGSSGYALSGSLVSSAFDMGNSSPVQIIEWDESIPSCSPVCSLRFQVRTAPDSSGSPGTWTDWYGSTGSGTYFTSAGGTTISVDLNDNQWVQYRVELAGDGVDTPILEEVRTYYR